MEHKQKKTKKIETEGVIISHNFLKLTLLPEQ